MFKRLITWLYDSYLEELVLESLSEQSQRDSENLSRLAHRTADIIRERRDRAACVVKDQPLSWWRRYLHIPATW